MKKLFAIAIVTFFLSANINAQVKRNVDPAQKIQRDKNRSEMKNEIRKLDLTQDQKIKMKALLEDAKKQRDAIINDASLSKAQKAQKMQQLKIAEKQKVSALLTPEQRTKAKDYLETRRDNKEGNGNNGKAGNGQLGKKYQKEIASLDLSQSQKDQLKVYIRDAQQKRDAIKSDASLTPAQKKAKLKTLKKDAYGKMEKILTPEQRAKAKVYIDEEMKKR